MEEKDLHLASIIGKRRGSVSGLDYELVPYSQDKKDIDIAAFVEDVITSLSDFEDNLKDLTDAIGKGYSVLELHWKLKNNRHVVTHMEHVAQKRFTWAEPKAPRLLTKEESWKGIELPPFKFIFHVHKTKSGHPARQGVLRVAAWMYLFKNYDLKSWVRFAEVFGLPLRIGKYDSNAGKEDRDALIKAVRSLGADAAGIISKATEIEFVEAAKESGAGFFKLLADFCNAEMSKGVLGQTLTTEQGDKGARSLGLVHQEVEAGLQKDDCEQVSKSIRRDLIRPLVGFNFGWDAPLPWFKLQYEDPGDLQAEAERYKVHLESGIEITTDHYYEKFRIPKPGEKEEVIRFPGHSGPETLPAKNKCPSCSGVIVGKAGGGVDPHDTPGHFVARLLDQADMDRMVDPVRKLLDEAESLEGFRGSLLSAFNDMDPVDLGNLIEQALLAADLSGRFDAVPEGE